jgi:hypothetical protein
MCKLCKPDICRHVLVKGGDMPDSSDAIDIFFDGMIGYHNYFSSSVVCVTYISYFFHLLHV